MQVCRPGLLKRTISVQSSWVLVLHLSRWYWMAEQGSDIGRGGRDGTPRHLPCKPSTARWEQPKSCIHCTGQQFGSLSTAAVGCSGKPGLCKHLLSPEELAKSWVCTPGSPAAGRTPNRPPCQTSLEPKEHHLALKNAQEKGCPWPGADVQLHPHIPG